jgi:hypothetical protein
MSRDSLDLGQVAEDAADDATVIREKSSVERNRSQLLPAAIIASAG